MKRFGLILILMIVALVPFTTAFNSHAAPVQQRRLLQSTGRIDFLRVHDVGSAYGPPSDRIDVEVVIHLDTMPGKAYGFQLRNDGQRAARQGMLDLLRDAFAQNGIVTIDYWIDDGKNNGEIIRVALSK